VTKTAIYFYYYYKIEIFMQMGGVYGKKEIIFYKFLNICFCL
jgi:hypothetical protein